MTENLELLIKELASMPCETAWLEFKHNNKNPEMIGERICALANAAAYSGHHRAYMIWGVDDKTHELVGTTFHWHKEKVGGEELENWLRHSLSANADFEYGSVQIDGKWFGVLEIAPAVDKTVMFNKIEYIRVGSITKKLNDYPQLKADLWARLQHRNFETQVVKGGLSVAEVLELLDYSSYFSLQSQAIPDGYMNIIHYLQLDELVLKQDDGLFAITNLGALLFAKRLADFPSLARKALRIVQFGGSGSIDLLKDWSCDKGYAYGFEDIMHYLNALLPSREVIEDSLRKTEMLYPPLVLREAIANALIHQDLSITGMGPIVEIYDGRIEVCNPGLPLVDIRRIIDSPPKSRNDKLASLMRRLRMCEELGSGWDKMVFLCEASQLPTPQISTYADPESTKVTLLSKLPFALLSREAKLYACYTHACLMYVLKKPMNNQSLRVRFGIETKNAAMISRLLKEAITKGLIRAIDSEMAKKFQCYVPWWA